MKKRYLCAALSLSLFAGNVYCVENKTALDRVKSNDVNERMDGFYALSVAGPGTVYNCSFKIPDSVLAKKAVIDLLRKEKKYEADNLTNGMYSPKLGEGFGEYLGEIEFFVDSCEDESAIDLLPGPRTLKKYPQQTTESILSKLENEGKYIRLYDIGCLGEAAPYYKQTNKKLYDSVKSKLIDLVDDESASRSAAWALDKLNDVDLIPVFEKISKYDDSKGTARFVNGKKLINPVSGIAKKALKKLQQEKQKSLPNSATEQNKK